MSEGLRHMTLEEWDRRVAPFLATIEIRARQIKSDANQIIEWIKAMPAAPEFETRAFEELINARLAVSIAAESLQEAVKQYQAKEKVK